MIENPFCLRLSELQFENSHLEQIKHYNEKKKIQQMSLLERTNEMIFNSARISPKKVKIPIQMPIKTSREYDKGSFKRNLTIREKMQEKRDIFLINMILDRKEKQLKAIDKYIENTEINAESQEESILEESNRINRETDKIDLDLLRANKSAEYELLRRAELSKELKKKQQSLSILQSEIAKNIDAKQRYMDYYLFLSSICPQSKELFMHFSSPDILIDDIKYLENSNRFIAQQIDNFENQLGKEKSVSESLKLADQFLNNIESSIGFFAPAPPTGFPCDFMKDEHNTELELSQLNGMVQNTFYKCFGKESSILPIEMLRSIENELEIFYNAICRVNPLFVEMKSAQIYQKRKEENKKRELEKREALLLEKKEAAIARANKPIKKPNGRRIVPRILPQHTGRRNDPRYASDLIELEKLNNMLYGEINKEDGL